MSRRAGVVSIDIEAGTAKFKADMDSASAKLRQFGQTAHGSVSGVQAVSASLRVMEGNMTNNLRAAERFVANVLNLGPAMQAIFPVVGAIAFAGVIGELGKRMYDFFKAVKDAPKLVDEAFRSLNNSARLSADELRESNDRLLNDIAKLEGRRENGVALALDEARIVADKLGESLDADLQKLTKLLSEHQVGIWESLTTGQTRTGYVKDRVEGFAGEIQDKANAGYANVSAAKTPAAANAAVKQLEAVLSGAFDAQIQDFKEKLQDAQSSARRTVTTQARNSAGQLVNVTREIPGKDNEVERRDLEGAINNLLAERARILGEVQNYQLTGKKTALEIADAYSKLENPFKKWQTESEASLKGLKATLDSIGKPEAVQIAAKAYASAQQEIAKLNDTLREHHTALTAAQKAEIQTSETTKAQIQADTEWAKKMYSAQTSIAERIKSQEELTAAIGRGYEATKKASVELQLMTEMKERYNDPAFANDQNTLRSGFANEYESKHAEDVARAIDGLGDQIELERQLARVQSEGAEAVRQATLAIKLRQMAFTGATKEQLTAEMDLYNAQRENAVAGDVAKVNESVEAQNRLTTATLKGADAVRAARLENELSQIARDGDTPIPGAIGLGQRGAAAAAAAEAAERDRLAKVSADADPFAKVKEDIEDLQKARDMWGDTLAIEIKLRDLENERLRIMVEQTLQLKTAGAGVRAFFLEMQQNAKSAASIIYETLNSALDRTSENLAKLLTEKKPKGGWGQAFGQEFKDIGQSTLQSSIKSTLQNGLGAIGKHFGIKGLEGKPDGSEAKPFHVIAKGGGVGLPGAGSGSDDNTGPLGGSGVPWIFHLFGGGGSSDSGDGSSGGGGFLSQLLGSFGGMKAEGGDINPGKIYGVGDEYELLHPKNASTITPLSKLTGGGGNTTHNEYHMDFRGAEVGVENRVSQAIEASSHASVAHSVQATQERARRTPRGGRK